MQNNMKTIHLPLPEAHSILKPVKDFQGVAVGAYTIPCECGTIYIPQLGRVTEEYRKKLQSDLWLHHPEQSAVANTETTSCSNQLILELQQRRGLPVKSCQKEHPLAKVAITTFILQNPFQCGKQLQ
jgi:hypothetical protein